jgi:hypothetical protein
VFHGGLVHGQNVDEVLVVDAHLELRVEADLALRRLKRKREAHAQTRH